jgi:hypothetical protein
MSDLTNQKQELLLSFYKHAIDDMTWRRNAGYRTIIIGLGYCTLLLAVLAFNRQLSWGVKGCLSGVLLIGTLFGSGYLAANYTKYMAAVKKMVLIEEYVGAFDPEFLGKLGALFPSSRRNWPETKLLQDLVPFLSIIAFLVGGLITAGAILAM